MTMSMTTIRITLLGRAQPVIPPRQIFIIYVYEHDSLGSSSKNYSVEESSLSHCFDLLVARCTTGPRRADNNASSLDRRDAPLGHAEL